MLKPTKKDRKIMFYEKVHVMKVYLGFERGFGM